LVASVTTCVFAAYVLVVAAVTSPVVTFRFQTISCCVSWSPLLCLSLFLPFSQYQLSHATFRNCLGAYCHYMIDSSLTTPLPHLKSLYYTHMGGLAVSGSHGQERVLS
jgi:hypothetical protein